MVPILCYIFMLIGFVLLEIRATALWLYANGLRQFGLVHVQYHLIRIWVVRYNPIYGFLIPIFPIHGVTFSALSRVLSINFHVKF